ncbi:hypothetical protein TcCL_NonESM04666, partial [Trypanosoma cruzi]
TYESGRTAASTGASGPVVPETRQAEASGFRMRASPSHPSHNATHSRHPASCSAPEASPEWGRRRSTPPLGSNMVRMALLTEPQRAPPKPHGAAMCTSNARLVRALVDAVRPAPTAIP